MKNQPCLWSKESAFRCQLLHHMCNLPSPRYSLLEIALSFQNAQSVPVLVHVSRPLHTGMSESAVAGRKWGL